MLQDDGTQCRTIFNQTRLICIKNTNPRHGNQTDNYLSYTATAHITSKLPSKLCYYYERC